MSTGSEARWTPASQWQPHPEWWTADAEDADGAEREVVILVTSLIRCLQPEIVVETGTALGFTAAAIGAGLQRNGHGHLWTVEIDPAAADKATQFLAGLPVTVDTGDSMQWEPPTPIDFAWIDSGAAWTRVAEVNRWKDKFRPGAVIGVHDTAPNMGREATMHGMNALCGRLGWPVLNLRTPRGVMLAQAT